MHRKFILASIPLLAAAALLLAAEPASQPAGEKEVTKSGLTIIRNGAGESGAQSGDQVWVHYVGKLQNGTKFDSSRDRGEPIDFILGRGEVIKGWEEGILGMKIGEKRTLIIPPALAYGAQARGNIISANATLTFDIELRGIRKLDPEPGANGQTPSESKP